MILSVLGRAEDSAERRSRAALVHADPVSEALVRQQLEQILGSEQFLSSRRSCEMLRHIVESALQGQFDRLKERCIGVELFGRDPQYETAHDSIVRVAANDVRKRLVEYYRQAGPRQVRISVPTGVYLPEFEILEPAPAEAAPEPEPPAQPQAAETAAPAARPAQRAVRAMAALCLVLAAALLYSVARPAPPKAAPSVVSAAPPWPLSQVFDDRHRTVIVLADANAGILGVLRGSRITLQEYLRPNFLKELPNASREIARTGLPSVISGSLLTSYADAAIVLQVMKLAGRFADRVDVRSARDLRMRDLREGNFILLGSPSSNPWVSLFHDHLNFHETVSMPDRKAFLNRVPRPGEQPEYHGFAWTGSAGEEYAAVALLPTETKRGNVLILQGLHQEGTEAAGSLLAGEEGRKRLLDALGPAAGPPASFEALLRSKAVAGSSSATEIVAVRSGR